MGGFTGPIPAYGPQARKSRPSKIPSSKFPEPKRTGLAVRFTGQDRALGANLLGIVMPEIVQCADNLEVVILREKGFKKVLLVPQAMLLEDQSLGIVPWREDVMCLNEDAATERSKDLKILVYDIALWPDHV